MSDAKKNSISHDMHPFIWFLNPSKRGEDLTKGDATQVKIAGHLELFVQHGMLSFPGRTVSYYM